VTLTARMEMRVGSLDLRVAFDVTPGEVLALLGPNGAGKSTTLRCLAGLSPIDAGSIAIDGATVDDPVDDVFVEPEDRSIGVVFQQYLLFDHMSVLENVAFGLRARGGAKADARRTAHEWLERVGLADYAGQRPRVLSGGQAQRAALARALAPHPRVLLLDEPLAALDAGTRRTVRRDLRHHLASFDGMSVIVTHDPVDAYTLADRVAILDAGEVVQVGTFTEVTAHPRSRYVADLAGVNLVMGDVAAGVLTTAATAHVVISGAEPGPALAVIRPSSIVLDRSEPGATSARNRWTGTVTDIERLGDRARVSIDGALPLTAEITVAALDALELRPGDEVHASVKATDIEAYPA
jgi:molybdate transport system ATP-binding protein